MLRKTRYIIPFLFCFGSLQAQVNFDPDTVQFMRVSGPELADAYKNDLLFDDHGVLWAATQYGLYAYDGYDWKGGLSLPEDPLVKIDQWLENVQQDSLGNIWFGSQINGVHKLNVESGKITAYPAGEFTGDPLHNFLTNELPLIDHQMMVQTYRGFVRFNPYSGSYQDVHIPFPRRREEVVFGIPGASRVNTITEYLPDSRDTGIVWLGTRDGMIKYLLDTEEAIAFDWPFDNLQMPEGRHIGVLDVHQAGDSLLIGTYGSGFVSYRKDMTKWRMHLIEPADTLHPNGIWSNVIQQITPLNDTLILFGSNRAPGVFNWSTGEIQWFNIPQESARSSTFRNILVDHNGCVWTNNFNGVYRSVAPLFPPQKDPQIVITNCKVTDGPGWRGYLPVIKECVELNEHQNTLELSYALVNPVRPEAVRYAYKLEGFDKQWVEAGQRRFVRYANLKGGGYTFHLRAIDYQGNTYEAVVMQFDIAIPFYRSLWFIVLMSGIVAGVLYFIYRQHVGNIRAQEKLKSEFDIKLSNMELQALRSQMSPHFIFNSLNSIKYYVINREADEAADYLTKFAQLIRIILENSKSELLTLEQEMRALKLYCEIEMLRFEEEFEYQFKVDPQINVEQFRIPPMLVQPHIENAIWHGLMHKEGERVLKVSFERANGGVICTVEDNGIGRERAAQLARERKRKKKSLGTKITADRITMINKLYQTNVNTTVEDVTNARGDVAGTRVRIFIQNLNKN